MAEETKQKTAPFPILEWMDGDAALICAGPACTFGADATTAADADAAPATPTAAPASSSDKPA